MKKIQKTTLCHSVRWGIGILLSTLMGGLSSSESEELTNPFTLIEEKAGFEIHSTLHLGNGETITGILTGESVSLQTAYASLKIDYEQIQKIRLGGTNDFISVIWTWNHQRFSGFLKEAFFLLRASDGTVEKVHRGDVSQISFNASKQEIPKVPELPFIVLNNGDYFHGDLPGGSISFLVNHGKVVFESSEMRSLTLVDSATFGLFNINTIKERREGRLENKVMIVGTEPGQQLSVFQEQFAAIYFGKNELAEFWNQLETLDESGFYNLSQKPVIGKNFFGLIWIPPGQFAMGSPDDEKGRDFDEGPQTKVTLTRGFWMGQHEVTQKAYKSILSDNPSRFKGDENRPVERVNWNEAMTFCNRLTDIAKENQCLPEGYLFRLPTEAEWEYACRGNTQSRFSYGPDPDHLYLDEYSWFTQNSNSSTHAIGGLKPNPLGLYDMHGNVSEWCLDRWQGALSGGSVTDPYGTSESFLRIVRGGSWLYGPNFSRSANRNNYGQLNQVNDIGFRVVLGPELP
ncbi:MAG TPA: formylglycine-generating enzyme family protein [Verrucomicrobiales bacterium]|nr:formylglycine-generating enzyme family protein [Verrucomicrobiales bacterium]